MRINTPDDPPDWINPSLPETWTCQHDERPIGHTTLYVIHNGDWPKCQPDDVLYVGITGNVRRRFKQHSKAKPWFRHSEMCLLECYPSWEEACEAERSRIDTWQPVYNIVRDHQLESCDLCGFPITDGGTAPVQMHQRCWDSERATVDAHRDAGMHIGTRNLLNNIRRRYDPDDPTAATDLVELLLDAADEMPYLYETRGNELADLLVPVPLNPAVPL